MICCPFCKSENLTIQNPNPGGEMGVCTFYGNDEEYFDGPIVLVNCGKTNHGFYIDTKQAKQLGK